MQKGAFLAVETGGTKTVCRIVDDAGRTRGEARFATTTPEAVAAAVLAQTLEACHDGPRVTGIGIASFGPVVVDPSSPDLGRMLATPKAGWTGSNLARTLSQALNAPVSIDTDVNAAALAEQASGAGRGLHTVAYVTVGTGIGGGLALSGQTLRGALHPEVGHLRVRRAIGDKRASVCRFHEDCVEGLASGPAVACALNGRSLKDAPDVQALLEDYLGQLSAILLSAWSPQRIVFGGGVVTGLGRLDRVHERMCLELNGYGVMSAQTARPDMSLAELEHAGLEGALILARGALATRLIVELPGVGSKV